MIKTGRFGGISVGGHLADLLAEYDCVGRAIIRGAISAGYDKSVLRALFELCFNRVMEVLDEEEQ